jgi:hypothetical protein
LSPEARRPGPLRPVWAYALLALLAAGLSYLVLVPLPEGDARRAALYIPSQDRAASHDQDIVSITFVSRESGLKVQWFFNRHFNLKEDIE